MKRCIFFSIVLFIVALPVALLAKEKPKPVDMKNIKTVFIGWVDVNPEDYHKQGYSTKAEWTNVIMNANLNFQKHCQGLKGLAGRTVTGAKDRGDADPGANDLYIKFSDVQFDHKYRLHISVHFVDPKTNSELGSIPLETYGAHFCTLAGCMDKELDEVANKIDKQLVGGGASQ